MHPEFEKHGSFAHLKLGRKPTRRDDRTLELAKYINVGALPEIPATLALPAVASWPMYGNDQLGDCTIAAAGHMIQAWGEDVGAPTTPPDEWIATAYWETGTPPAASGTAGSPEDDGRDEIGVLNYWREPGIGADRIGAYASVDPADEAMVRAAMYLFGGVYTGIALPATAQGQAEWAVVGDGQSGESAPGSWGGHAVPYEAYDADGIELVTWGGTLKATWGFHAAYTEEVYAIISPDALNTAGSTWAGFDLEQLTADLALVTAPAKKGKTKAKGATLFQKKPADPDAGLRRPVPGPRAQRPSWRR